MSKHSVFPAPARGDTPRRYTADWSALLAFGLIANLLTLTGPLFMLQVYDRVLPSRSIPTLTALLGLAAALYLALIALEVIRARIGIRIGAAYQSDHDIDVLTGALSLSGPARETDLEAVRRFAASPLPAALLDLPFTPVYFAAIALLHPALAALAVAGATMIVALSMAGQLASKAPARRSRAARIQSERIGADFRRAAADLSGLGLTRTAAIHWHLARESALADDVRLSARTASFAAVVRGLRLMLQSGLLALGAWLVMDGQASGGAMIASSVLMGRALQPIEQIVAGWGLIQSSWAAWRALADKPDSMSRPMTRPHALRAELRVTSLRLPQMPPVTLSLDPGSALAIIGESGAGKTTLLRALGGMRPDTGRSVRLSGIALEDLDPDRRAKIIGYLPQQTQLFTGTVAQNVSRFDPDCDTEAVAKALSAAGASDLVARLPDGIETRLGIEGYDLSGGEAQSIALARALYGDPIMLLLDEPDSHLDARGTAAVNAAVARLKAAGRIVVLIAHRPAMLDECDQIIRLRAGRAPMIGPRDQILDAMRSARPSEVTT